MILCIIPARAGSKGIPGKNIKHLLGKPLIVWSIEAALNSEYIDRVVVSTDGENISRVSKKFGAEVLNRSKQLSGDFVSSELVLLDVLQKLEDKENYTPELVVFLQATSPYRLPEDIDNAIKFLKENNFDSVFSAVSEHFVGRWKKSNNQSAMPINFKIDRRPMRQEYDVEYLENGSIYVFRPFLIKKFSARMGGKIGIYEMPRIRSFQIDNDEDFQLLEHLMSYSYH